MKIITLEAIHWPDVSRIYGEGIRTAHATFQTEIPTWESWDKDHLPNCRFVLLDNEQVAAWIALAPVSGRCVYAGVAELSVYVGEAHRGKKIGKQLLEHLIQESEKQGLWTLQAGVFPENQASIKLHKSVGFREIGYHEKLGQMKNGTWRDVVLLERRSRIVGF
jgi:L-amino acid N-acyltransferase YncA